MENFLKIILIIFILALSFNLVLAAEFNYTCVEGVPQDEQPYPWCGTKELGSSEGLVAKFYIYALAAVGVAALGAIIYGGILYTVSAGNTSKQREAKEWITGAIWGIVLLLGAALLLGTINPELVKLEEPSIPPVKFEPQQGASSGKGVILEGGECFESADCLPGLKCFSQICVKDKSKPISPSQPQNLPKGADCDPFLQPSQCASGSCELNINTGKATCK